jgi:uncharacterized protein YktA (UPF0223 family)
MYTYPIDYELYTKEEIIDIIDFLQAIEQANESSIKHDDLRDKYQVYRQIIRSKSMEKQIDKAFKKASGYSIYQTMKQIK